MYSYIIRGYLNAYTRDLDAIILPEFLVTLPLVYISIHHKIPLTLYLNLTTLTPLACKLEAKSPWTRFQKLFTKTNCHVNKYIYKLNKNFYCLLHFNVLLFNFFFFFN